jgi:hypothetical protein
MFVVITAWCIWLGYHADWMYQRRALLSERDVAASFTPKRCPPSLGLWLLGERGATSVFLQYNGYVGEKPDEALRKLASQLYPEAKIEEWGGTIMPLGHPGVTFGP